MESIVHSLRFLVGFRFERTNAKDLIDWQMFERMRNQHKLITIIETYFKYSCLDTKVFEAILKHVVSLNVDTL